MKVKLLPKGNHFLAFIIAVSAMVFAPGLSGQHSTLSSKALTEWVAPKKKLTSNKHIPAAGCEARLNIKLVDIHSPLTETRYRQSKRTLPPRSLHFLMAHFRSSSVEDPLS